MCLVFLIKSSLLSAPVEGTVPFYIFSEAGTLAYTVMQDVETFFSEGTTVESIQLS